MVKNKKKKNVDFQKVKLKVGKKLPKGQNVTNTSFKTRNIQIVQQIKSDVTQPSTHRKLNIQDLLTKCQHYNMTVRQEGLSGLRELVTSFTGLITTHLSPLIEKAMPLIVDKDNNVRKAALKLFTAIFTNTEANRVEPFFPVISAHLCCAMTHIYDEVQHDSLDLFDVLLDTYPLLIAKNSGQLLQNFIEQISRQQNVAKKSSKLSLAVRPDSKYSVHRWRSGVLSRIYKLLSALLTWTYGEASEECKEKQATAYKSVSIIPLQFSTGVRNSWSLPGYKPQTTAASVGPASKGDNLNEFATSLIPLLIQCWVECRSTPGQAKTQGSLVGPDSVSVMYHIMRVLNLLFQCLSHQAQDEASQSQVMSVHQKEFTHHFMTNFPYSVQDVMAQKGKKSKKTPSLVSSETVNLAICEVMTSMLSARDTNRKRTTFLAFSIGEYLCLCPDGEDLGNKESKTLVTIVERFVKACPNKDMKEKVLEKAVLRYIQAHPLSTEKRLYLEMFAGLFLDSNLPFSKSGSHMDQFFQSLPELLPLVHSDNPKMAAVIVRVMRQAACQNCKPLLHNLQKGFVDFLDIEGGLFTRADVDLQRGLIDALYWVPHLDKKLLKLLVNVCHHGNTATSEALYLLDIIHARFQKDIESEIQLVQRQTLVTVTTTYLSFLMSVLLYAIDKEEKMDDTECTDFAWSVTEGQWRKHSAVVQRVCHQLQHLPDVTSLSPDILHFFIHSLMVLKKIHITTMYSFLHCLSTFKSLGPCYQILCDFVTELIISLALSLVAMVPSDDHMTNVTNELWDLVSKCVIGLPAVLKTFFNKLEMTFQEGDKEKCVSKLKCLSRLTQDVSLFEKKSLRSLADCLTSLQTTVQKKSSVVMESEEWKSFLYSVTVVMQMANADVEMDTS